MRVKLLGVKGQIYMANIYHIISHMVSSIYRIICLLCLALSSWAITQFHFTSPKCQNVGQQLAGQMSQCTKMHCQSQPVWLCKLFLAFSRFLQNYCCQSCWLWRAKNTRHKHKYQTSLIRLKYRIYICLESIKPCQSLVFCIEGGRGVVVV